jgi:hypothetical protein
VAIGVAHIIASYLDGPDSERPLFGDESRTATSDSDSLLGSRESLD